MVLRCIVAALAAAGVLCAQNADPTPAELRTLMRQVLVNLQRADDQLGDYGYDRYNERRMLDGAGKVKNLRTVLARRTFIDGGGFTQQIERDGKAVAPAEIARERAAFSQRQAEIRTMTAAERRKLDEAALRERREELGWIKEFPDALRYRKIGEEMIDGRVAIVLECDPQPGYKPANLRARVYEKVRGRIWIDKAESQIVRIEARVFDDVNVGWGLAAKIYKGTEFQLERRRLPEGSWLPLAQRIKFAARLMLVKSLAQEESTRYSAYRHKSLLQATGTAREEEGRSRAEAAK